MRWQRVPSSTREFLAPLAPSDATQLGLLLRRSRLRGRNRQNERDQECGDDTDHDDSPMASAATRLSGAHTRAAGPVALRPCLTTGLPVRSTLELLNSRSCSCGACWTTAAFRPVLLVAYSLQSCRAIARKSVWQPPSLLGATGRRVRVGGVTPPA